MEDGMDSTRRGALRGASAAGLLLLLAAPSPSRAWAGLRDVAAATDPTGPLVCLLALSAWVLAGWLLLIGLLTLAGRLPGVAGRCSAACSRRVAPAAVRRAVEVALGLTVAVGVLGASPASASVQGPPAAAPPAAAVSLDWSAPAPATDLDWPAPSPVLEPASEPASAADMTVVVRPGDTLWGLAEQSLRAAGDAGPTDAEIAQAWPAWWAANRDAVGDDPDLLRPGTSLAPPDADRAGPSSS
jgi:nucleoid-associated protein YgaU